MLTTESWKQATHRESHVTWLYLEQPEGVWVAPETAWNAFCESDEPDPQVTRELLSPAEFAARFRTDEPEILEGSICWPPRLTVEELVGSARLLTDDDLQELLIQVDHLVAVRQSLADPQDTGYSIDFIPSYIKRASEEAKRRYSRLIRWQAAGVALLFLLGYLYAHAWRVI